MQKIVFSYSADWVLIKWQSSLKTKCRRDGHFIFQHVWTLSWCWSDALSIRIWRTFARDHLCNIYLSSHVPKEDSLPLGYADITTSSPRAGFHWHIVAPSPRECYSLSYSLYRVFPGPETQLGRLTKGCGPSGRLGLSLCYWVSLLLLHQLTLRLLEPRA